METTIIETLENKITGSYVSISNAELINTEYNNKMVAGSKYNKLVFENIIFDGCHFQATEIIGCIFIDCVFKNCDFNFTKFENCNSIACKIESCNFCITNSLNCNFLSCTYLINKWEGSKMDGSFLNCNISEEEYKKMNITCTYDDSNLSLESS